MSNAISPVVEASPALSHFEEDGIAHAPVPMTALATITKSELESQLDAAHRYPRSIAHFLKEAETMCTISEEVAGSCMYAVPRGEGGKTITGPSVRLAEIVASAYGNLQIATRILDPTDTEAIAQGAAWDVEKNIRITIEVRRRIVDKHGRRYSGDMVNVTGAAAASIALRNAVFRVVPRAYVDTLYAKARAVAVGEAATLAARREKQLAWINRCGVTTDRVLAALGRKGVEDVTLEDMETLVGLASSIRSHQLAVDEAFPPLKVNGAPAGASPLGQKLAAKAAQKGPASSAPKEESRAAGEVAVETTAAAAAADPPKEEKQHATKEDDGTLTPEEQAKLEAADETARAKRSKKRRTTDAAPVEPMKAG
jgi:hypothetical protein